MNAPVKVLLFAVCSLAACGAEVENVDSDSESGAAIVAGSIDTADGAVVALFTETSPIFCSAVIVSPTKVLTAAHCMLNPAIPAGAKRFIYLRSDLTKLRDPNFSGFNPALDSKNVIEVETAYKKPAKYQMPTSAQFTQQPLQSASGDIAVLTLKHATTVQPAVYNRASLDHFTNGMKPTATIIGYGESTLDPASGGVRRSAYAAVEAQPAADELEVGSVTHNIGTNDSGGPVLAKVNGRSVVIGVASVYRCGTKLVLVQPSDMRGDMDGGVNFGYESVPYCAAGYFTRIDSHLSELGL